MGFLPIPKSRQPQSSEPRGQPCQDSQPPARSQPQPLFPGRGSSPASSPTVSCFCGKLIPLLPAPRQRPAPLPGDATGAAPGRALGWVPAGAMAASLGNPSGQPAARATGQGMQQLWGRVLAATPAPGDTPFPSTHSPRAAAPTPGTRRDGTAHAKGPEQPSGLPEPQAQHRDARARLPLAHKDPRSHRMGTFPDPP